MILIMEQTNLKNIIVLKDLPSNLIEEAVIVFKNKKTVKEIEKIEKDNRGNKDNKNKKIRKNNSYAIKEAELVINEYMTKMEEKRRNKNVIQKNINEKIKKLKIYSIATSIVITMETILLVIIK